MYAIPYGMAVRLQGSYFEKDIVILGFVGRYRRLASLQRMWKSVYSSDHAYSRRIIQIGKDRKEGY